MTPPPKKHLMILGLATAGLSSCNGTSSGVMDPPPPPAINCQSVGQGQTLKGTGTLAGSALTLKITNQDVASFWSQAPAVSNPAGLTNLSLTMDSANALTLTGQLATPQTTTASFSLNGTLRDGMGNACLVSKSFTVTIGSGGAVTVAQQRSSPLGPRPPISIQMLAQRGLEVDLVAGAVPPGSRLEWTASSGQILDLGNGEARWTLPETAGLHQVELFVDGGEGRLALETLALEVG